MPTVFDILGATSFAQGVLTLIVTTIIAVLASTQQIRDTARNNDVLTQKLTMDVRRMLEQASDLEKSGHLSEPTQRVLTKWQSWAASTMNVVDMYSKKSYLVRLSKGKVYAQKLAQLSEEKVQLIADMNLVHLEWRLISAFEEMLAHQSDALRLVLEQRGQ